MKLLVDESLPRRVADLLLEAGHEAAHAGDRGLLGARDEAVMATARQENRVVTAGSEPPAAAARRCSRSASSSWAPLSGTTPPARSAAHRPSRRRTSADLLAQPPYVFARRILSAVQARTQTDRSGDSDA